MKKLDVQGMTACLAGQSDVVVVYLFGSVAQGQARPGSDVDVAVLVDAVRPAHDGAVVDGDPLTLFERRLVLTSAVEPFVEGKLDLVLLNQAPNLLQSQVLRERCVLYERSWPERVAFEVAVMKVYHDLKVMRDRQWESFLRQMEEGHLGRRRRGAPRTIDLARQLSRRLTLSGEHNVRGVSI